MMHRIILQTKNIALLEKLDIKTNIKKVSPFWSEIKISDEDYNLLRLTHPEITLITEGTFYDGHLDMFGLRTKLPDNLTVTGTLSLYYGIFKHLPKNLKVGFLDLQNCKGIKKLPNDLTSENGANIYGTKIKHYRGEHIISTKSTGPHTYMENLYG